MEPDPLEWIAAVNGLIWLIGAALLAARNRPERPAQMRRLPLTVLTFAGGFAFVLIAGFLLGGNLDEALPYILVGTLIVTVAAFVTALIVDIGGRALGAVRTPSWLAVGIGMAVSVTYGWLYLIFAWFGGGDAGGFWRSAPAPIFLTPALVAAAAGLIWWSELPREGE